MEFIFFLKDKIKTKKRQTNCTRRQWEKDSENYISLELIPFSCSETYKVAFCFK
jgi:hypothetical protein